MPRVKGGYVTRRRRNKVLKLAKGYFGSKHTLYKTAHEQVMRSLKYSYRDRRAKKRNFRKLWISRINAACKMNDIKYSRFINGLKLANIEINRKMLAEIAVSDMPTFVKYVEIAKNPVIATPTKVEEAIKVVEEEKKEATSIDLNSLKVADLRELAKEKGVSGYTTMKKQELIDALK